ncbi:Uncharacterized protein RNJ44_03857 [Nakaseomyces bracarensis]|uniref:PX domain-containing protein n=1 Tax=Nakaseomyces bracarensis TaxID=273131 RepID=A0ABR4NYC0_9SACH
MMDSLKVDEIVEIDTIMATIDAVQEHYLKRELLKYQLDKEFGYLNDALSLREFGYPFTREDPRTKIKKADSYGTAISNALWSSATYFTGGAGDGDGDGDGNGNGADSEGRHDHNGGKQLVPDLSATKFPLLSYFLQEFIFSFPLLSKNMSIDESFWQTKVQVFFEHFMSMGFSDSYDREENSKRRVVGLKMKKVIMLLFNSGIGASQEKTYYENDKLTTQQEKTRKRSNLEEFTMPTKENLKFLVTHEPVFFNNWDVAIVAVVNSSYFSEAINNSLSKSLTGNSSSSSSLHSTGSSFFRTKDLKKTSKMFKSAFGAASNTTSSMFSKLSGSASYSTVSDNKSISSMDSAEKKHKKGKYYFIIRTRRADNPEVCQYNFKSYNDFKKLAHKLKKEFPSKKLPQVPSKKSDKKVLRNIKKEVLENKTDQPNIAGLLLDEQNEKVNIPAYNSELLNDQSSFGDDISKEESDEEADGNDAASFDSNTESTKYLPFETLRATLRLYLRTLTKEKEVVNSSIWKDFVAQDIIEDHQFDEAIANDIKLREISDIKNLENQIAFQKLALEKTVKLQTSMKDFKTNLLEDEKYLLELVGEIKTKTRVEDLSQNLQDFVEWCKIYLASILYQMFLGNDNSTDFYKQIRKLHKLLPYTVMSQIMRFTNPVSIMKGMVDLFMAQPFGGQSLLQTMFSTILSEDIKHQKVAIKSLETNVLSFNPDAKHVLVFLKNCVFGTEKSKAINIHDIQEESDLMQMPVVILLLMKGTDKGYVKKNVVAELINSYSMWKHSDASDEEQTLEGKFYLNIHELLHLYIKEHDKRLMRQLWQDPELQQLLRAMVTLIYEPMVKIFKVARMDLALRNFEKFMDDLIVFMDDVTARQLHVSSKFNIVEGLLALVTKHQNSFFEFLHDVYTRDTEGIFEGFITWFTKIIRFLQKSKFGSDNERMDFNALINNPKSDVDKEVLINQINEVLKKKMEARKLYWQILEEKMNKKDEEKKNMSKAVMDNNWKSIQSMIIPSSSDKFGVEDGDMLDLDMEMDAEQNRDIEDTKLEKQYQEVLDRTIVETEVEKLCQNVFDDALKEKLSTYRI